MAEEEVALTPEVRRQLYTKYRQMQRQKIPDYMRAAGHIGASAVRGFRGKAPLGPIQYGVGPEKLAAYSSMLNSIAKMEGAQQGAEIAKIRARGNLLSDAYKLLGSYYGAQGGVERAKIDADTARFTALMEETEADLAGREASDATIRLARKEMGKFKHLGPDAYGDPAFSVALQNIINQEIEPGRRYGAFLAAASALGVTPAQFVEGVKTSGLAEAAGITEIIDDDLTGKLLDIEDALTERSQLFQAYNEAQRRRGLPGVEHGREFILSLPGILAGDPEATAQLSKAIEKMPQPKGNAEPKRTPAQQQGEKILDLVLSDSTDPPVVRLRKEFVASPQFQAWMKANGYSSYDTQEALHAFGIEYREMKPKLRAERREKRESIREKSRRRRLGIKEEEAPRTKEPEGPAGLVSGAQASEANADEEKRVKVERPEEHKQLSKRLRAFEEHLGRELTLEEKQEILEDYFGTTARKRAERAYSVAQKEREAKTAGIFSPEEPKPPGKKLKPKVEAPPLEDIIPMTSADIARREQRKKERERAMQAVRKPSEAEKLEEILAGPKPPTTSGSLERQIDPKTAAEIVRSRWGRNRPKKAQDTGK